MIGGAGVYSRNPGVYLTIETLCLLRMGGELPVMGGVPPIGVFRGIGVRIIHFSESHRVTHRSTTGTGRCATYRQGTIT